MKIIDKNKRIKEIIDGEIYGAIMSKNYRIFYLLHTDKDYRYYVNLIGNHINCYSSNSTLSYVFDLKGLENDIKTRIINTFGGIHGKDNIDEKTNIDKDNVILTIGLLKGMNRIIYEKI